MKLVKVQYNTFNRSVLPALEKTGLHLIAEHEKSESEAAGIRWTGILRIMYIRF